jgi:hypothetical protein
MSVERPLVWLLALAAAAVSVLAYTRPGVAPAADLVLVGLLVAAALPLAAAFAPLVFDRGERGWR